MPTPGFAEADVCAAAFALHADERVHCLLFVLHKKCKTLEQAAKISMPSTAAAGGASREGQVRGYPTGWHSAPLNIQQEGAQELVAPQEREECIDLIVCCHRRSHLSAVPPWFRTAEGKGQCSGRAGTAGECVIRRKPRFSLG